MNPLHLGFKFLFPTTSKLKKIIIIIKKKKKKLTLINLKSELK